MKKKIIIGILVAALIAGGAAGGGVYYRKSHQKTVSVVSVDSLAGQYYAEDTNLDGTITTSAVQNISVDKDMIIQELYVSKGDSVSKGDKLISFDMTLVEMELKIAKLKQQQQEQNLNKAINRLNSLKNGGPIEESDGDTTDTSSDLSTDTDTDTTGDEDDLEASAAGSVSGAYLAAVMRPVLAAADIFTDEFTDTEETQSASAQIEEESNSATDGNSETGDSDNGNADTSQDEISVDFSSDEDDINGSGGNADGSNSADTPDISADTDTSETEDTDESDLTGEDISDIIEDTDPGSDPGNSDITDGEPNFYQVLDSDSMPFKGKGTKKSPYVFLCSSAKGYVTAKGSFLNKMAGYKDDGTKDFGVDGYWYKLEFHQNDTITDFTNRKESCTGYYLIDGSLLDKMVDENSEVEFSLDEASHYEKEDPDPGGGGDGSDDSSCPGEKRWGFSFCFHHINRINALVENGYLHGNLSAIAFSRTGISSIGIDLIRLHICIRHSIIRFRFCGFGSRLFERLFNRIQNAIGGIGCTGNHIHIRTLFGNHLADNSLCLRKIGWCFSRSRDNVHSGNFPACNGHPHSNIAAKSRSCARIRSIPIGSISKRFHSCGASRLGGIAKSRTAGGCGHRSAGCFDECVLDRIDNAVGGIGRTGDHVHLGTLCFQHAVNHSLGSFQI